MNKSLYDHKISPKFKASDFPNGYASLEEKITVFEDRIFGWQLNIAEEMIGKIKHSDYAKLSIVLSCFEMLGKHIAGYADKYESKDHFLKGMRYVYPDLNENQEDIFSNVYINIRNGLYHASLTSSKVHILNSKYLKESIVQEGTGESARMLVSPNNLITNAKTAFSKYISELRQESNSQLRSNFEKRFDFDNGITQ